MTRFAIPIRDFIDALERADDTQFAHMLRDFQFDNEFCYPVIDRRKHEGQDYHRVG
jgi:hypothetical protein